MESRQNIHEQPTDCVTSQGMDANTYAMLMHLSQFAMFILPFIGWCAPIILWAMRREDSYIDRQGKLIFNWMISATLYSIVLLIFMLILPLLSLLMFFILGIASVVFIILSAVAAKKGELSAYPLALRFFK